MNDEHKGYLQWLSAHEQQTEEAKRAIIKLFEPGFADWIM